MRKGTGILTLPKAVSRRIVKHMKVVVLEEYLRDVASAILDSAEVVYFDGGFIAKDTGRSRLLSVQLSANPTCIDELIDLKPDVILASLPDPFILPKLREELLKVFGKQVFLYHHDPMRLEEIYQMFETMGRELKKPEKGRALAHRVKAQVMDWSSNFYDRIKNKRVTFISKLDPLSLGGRWIPDMIRVASGHPQALLAQRYDQIVKWDEIVTYNPDVIIIALAGVPFQEALKSFKVLAGYPHWENIFAVKRGDVYFTDGQKYFNSPTPKLMDSMGILISAMAGFESGYITPRDSMYKLRFLELHRHKFL